MYGTVYPCERCGADAQFTTQVSPLGDEPHKVYRCASCGHFTWAQWHGPSGPRPPKPR